MQTGNTPDTVKYWFSEPPPQSCMNFIEIMKIGTNMRHGNNPYDKSHLTCQTKIAPAIKTFVEKDNEMSLSMMQNITEWKKVVDIVKPVDDEGKYPCLRIVESPSGLKRSAKDAGAQVTAIDIGQLSANKLVGTIKSEDWVPICHIYDILEYREMCCLLEFADVGKGNIRKNYPAFIGDEMIQ